MKKSLHVALCLFISILSANSQTVSTLYFEGFEGSATALPAGWVSTPSVTAWQTSTSNNSSGYAGAGAGNNVKIDNTISSTGSYSLATKTVSTTGYSSITVSWGARFTVNFPPSSISPFLYYSTNGGTSWASVSYTEASSGSAWKLNGPIALPAAADNQPSLMFQLIANITAGANGTYRIDDFTVSGIASAPTNTTTVPTTTTGIKANTLSQQLESYVYEKTLSVKTADQNVVINAIKLYEITGKEVISKLLPGETQATLPLSDFNNGIYIVKFELSNGQSVIKKIVLF